MDRDYEPCDKCNRKAVADVKFGGFGFGIYCREHADQAQAEKLAYIERQRMVRR